MKNGSTVYHCKRISLPDDDIEIFSKPIPYVLRTNYLTIQPASGIMDNQAFGEFTDQTNKGIAQPYEKWVNEFKTGDRMYIGTIPEGYVSDTEPTDGWGYDANAQIIAVKPQNKAISLTIRNIVK